MSWKCQRLAPNWVQSQFCVCFYLLIIGLNILGTIVVFENIHSSIMQWWPREFNPHPSQFVSCLLQFSNKTTTWAASWCGSQVIQSSINQGILFNRVEGILVVTILPMLCHLLDQTKRATSKLPGVVLLCTYSMWMTSIVSLRCYRNHLTAPGVSTCLLTAISEVRLKRHFCAKVWFSCEGQTRLAYLFFSIAVYFCVLWVKAARFFPPKWFGW